MGPSQLMKEREVELRNQHSIYTMTNSVHRSSCIENYYQCGMQDTRQNMLLELFSQIINENCYNQLRTQEQLGYIVFSGVRRSNGAQGLRVIVQSDRHPVYLDQRIESFLDSVNKSLEEMEDDEFKQHVEALATKRLEKPKKMGVRNGRFWSEILSQHYNFNRDEIEVECLRQLTKEDISSFYKQFITDSDGRRKLSCHVVSMCEGGAGTCDTEETSADSKDNSKSISDITEFKSSLPLFPLVQPFVKLETLKRPEQP